MDDQFDNRHDSGFSMTGDVFNHNDETFNDTNIPSLDKLNILESDNEDECNWRDEMAQGLRNEMGLDDDKDLHESLMGKSVMISDQDDGPYWPGEGEEDDPIAKALADLKEGKDVTVNVSNSLRVAPNKCGCCYGNDGKCFNSIESQNRKDKAVMTERRNNYEKAKAVKNTVVVNKKPTQSTKSKSSLPHDLSADDEKIQLEISKCQARIKEIKENIDSAEKRDISTYLKNRLTKMYENKQYELKCLQDSLDPVSSNTKKMEEYRAKYFSLEKQKAEIEMQMLAIETKFHAEKMSIEERDNKPDVETMIQGHDDDMDRLWALRANRQKIYNAEYDVDPNTGVTTHNKSDFKKAKFMRKQLIAHNARKIAEHNADALK